MKHGASLVLCKSKLFRLIIFFAAKELVLVGLQLYLNMFDLHFYSYTNAVKSGYVSL